MKRSWLCLYVILSTFLITTQSTHGQTRSSNFGKLFTSGPDHRIEKRSPQGELLELFPLSNVGDEFENLALTGLQFDPHGNLWVADFYAGQVIVLSPSGPELRRFSTRPFLEYPESIRFDPHGNALIGGESWATEGQNWGNLLRVDLWGNLLDVLEIPATSTGKGTIGINYFEILCDEKTLVYTEESARVRCFDLQTRTPMEDVSNLGEYESYLGSLRLLPDEGFLVTGLYSIYRLDAWGNLVQSYTSAEIIAWYSLALTPDGRSFWAADYGDPFCQDCIGQRKTYRFDLDSGALLGQFVNRRGDGLYGLAMIGEPSPCYLGSFESVLTKVVTNHVENSPSCVADFDGDGFVNGVDFDAFVYAFEAGELRADVDRNGFINGLDFDLFVFHFQNGC